MSKHGRGAAWNLVHRHGWTVDEVLQLQASAIDEARKRKGEMDKAPITWARFIMLAEAAGIRADDEMNAILWFEDRRQVGLDRDENGKAVLY